MNKRNLSLEEIELIVRRGHLIKSADSENFKLGKSFIISDFEIFERFHLKTFPPHVIEELEFKNCIFHDAVLIDNHGNISSYKFTNVTFNANLEIRALNRPIQISGGCHFMGDCIISTNGTVVLKILDTNFNKSLSLHDNFKELVLENININNSKKDEDSSSTLKLNGNTIQYLKSKLIRFNSVEISNGTIFAFEATFEELQAQNFNINNITIGLQLNLKKSQIGSLIIDNLKENHRHIKIIDGCAINQISIPLHQVDNVQILNSSFQELRFWGTNSIKGIINIEKIIFRSLIFDEIINLGLITLRNIKAEKKSSLELKSSDFGKANFIFCDFKQSILKFENSKITELFLAETDFPLRVSINKKDSPAQAQLAFGQLQTAFNKQGDSIRALEYHSREIAAHFREIRFKPKYFFTSFNLFLNLLSNNFGRRWWQGVLFTILTGILFFYLIIRNSVEFPKISYNENLFLAYLKFMNPIRSFDTESIFKKNSGIPFLDLKTIAYLCDFIGKIVIAYGYYQTIQAFRRYGRK